MPEPKEIWELKEAEQVYIAFKEASATEEEQI